MKFNFQSFFESFLQIRQKQYKSDVLRETQLKVISFQNYRIVKKFDLSLSPSKFVIMSFSFLSALCVIDPVMHDVMHLHH